MPDPLFETFLTSRGLNGLCQKGCHILVKNWIFDDTFHKKLPLGAVSFFCEIWTLKAVETGEFAEAAKVNEPEEVFKGWKITIEDKYHFILMFKWCIRHKCPLLRKPLEIRF